MLGKGRLGKRGCGYEIMVEVGEGRGKGRERGRGWEHFSGLSYTHQSMTLNNFYATINFNIIILLVKEVHTFPPFPPFPPVLR